MEDELEIPIIYKGEPLTIQGKVLAFGYVYKLSVDINGVEIIFEKDDAGDYRAILSDPDSAHKQKPDAEMVKAILETLSAIS